jgi:hypothetical protein
LRNVPKACLQRPSTTAKSSRLRLHLQPASAPSCVLLVFSFIPLRTTRGADTPESADSTDACREFICEYGAPFLLPVPSRRLVAEAALELRRRWGARERKNQSRQRPGACVSLSPGSKHTWHLLLFSSRLASPCRTSLVPLADAPQQPGSDGSQWSGKASPPQLILPADALVGPAQSLFRQGCDCCTCAHFCCACFGTKCFCITQWVCKCCSPEVGSRERNGSGDSRGGGKASMC